MNMSVSHLKHGVSKDESWNTVFCLLGRDWYPYSVSEGFIWAIIEASLDPQFDLFWKLLSWIVPSYKKTKYDQSKNKYNKFIQQCESIPSKLRKIICTFEKILQEWLNQFNKFCKNFNAAKLKNCIKFTDITDLDQHVDTDKFDMQDANDATQSGLCWKFDQFGEVTCVENKRRMLFPF